MLVEENKKKSGREFSNSHLEHHHQPKQPFPSEGVIHQLRNCRNEEHLAGKPHQENEEQPYYQSGVPLQSLKFDQVHAVQNIGSKWQTQKFLHHQN